MGAPGARVWQGQVFAHNLRTDLQNSSSAVNPHSEDDSYLGYSLALGRFSSAGRDDDLAIGIPRGHQLRGKVMLADRELRILRNLTGEQMGAYFGYALAAADLNGDGLDDLLVGAPLYYNQTISHKEAHYERGRVYVYLQSSSSSSSSRHEFQLATSWDGPKNRARFGSSLANCGDLNRDGLQDVAVGAPNDGPQGHGAVYIYLGRRQVRADQEWPADQVIYAEQVRHEGHLLRSFGWSLSGGLDLDRNDYPDLLVGDYQSDRAVLLRARPVLNVSASITFTPEHFNLDERTCLLPNNRSRVPCISVQYCLRYAGGQLEPRLPFLIDIRLDTDNQKGAPRLFLVENELKSEDHLTQVYEREVEKCKSFKAYIQRTIRDKLTPLKVEVEYNLASDQQPELIDGQGLIRLRPIINKRQSNRLSKVAAIQKNCGLDNVCVPDLKLTMRSNLDQYTIGTNERLVLEVTVNNLGEDAYESMFYLTMPMTINYITTANKTRQEQPICYGAKPEQTGVNVLVCDLGNPQARNEQIKFSVVMEPARGNHTDADFTFFGLVNSTNPEQDERARENNHAAIGIPIRVEVNLVLSGKSSPALIEHNSTRRSLEPFGARNTLHQRPEPQVETDLGREVTHTYQLQNKGPSTINHIALTLLWPSRTDDAESHLLYLVDEPITSDKVRCKPPDEGSINPLKLKYLRGDSVNPAAPNSSSSSSSSSLARSRRQADEANDSTVDNSIVQQLYTVFCGQLKRCTRFECNVFDLGHNDIATVKIRSRLYEDTLDRPKINKKDFDISSRLVAQVKSLPYSVSAHSMPPYHLKVETQVHRLDLTVQDLLPWWLILVAILLGLLLFALLACFLRYLGFFARKRPPKGTEREPLTPTIWNDYQYTPGDTAL